MILCHALHFPHCAASVPLVKAWGLIELWLRAPHRRQVNPSCREGRADRWVLVQAATWTPPQVLLPPFSPSLKIT